MVSQKTEPFHVAIIGGGIGGLSLAIGLSKFPHITVTVYEAAAAVGKTGAEVCFGPNGHSVMHLIDPDLWRSYEHCAQFDVSEGKADTSFDLVYRTGGEQEGKKIFELNMENSMMRSTVNRAQFLEELIKLVPKGCVRFEKRCMGIEQSKQKVEMKFADGTIGEADVVIGCDGMHSICRGVVLGRDSEFLQPRFTGKVAYRGSTSIEELTELIGEEAGNRRMYIGHGGHVITLPVAGENVINVEAFASYEMKGDEWDGEWMKSDQKENIVRAYEGLGGIMKEIIPLISNSQFWAIFDHPLAPTYHRGRICLLGNSAHTSTPHVDDGAGIALEDAYILSNLLSLCTAKSDIGCAFKAYDAVRIPRTHRVIKDSREFGKMLDLEGEGVGDNLEILKLRLDASLKRIWNVDLKEHLEDAVVGFRKAKVREKLESMGIGSYIKNKRDAMSF